MKRTIVTILSAAAALLLFASPAAATDPLAGFCEDEACEQCEEDEVCTIATFEQLPHAEKLKNLGAQFNVETAYDSNNQLYRVAVDVTSAAGEGIIVIHEGHGNYDTVEEFYEAVSMVLGTEINPIIEDEGEERTVRFPEMLIRQTGTTIRLFIDSNGDATWAPANYRSNFLWDALSDENGNIIINGLALNLGPWLNPTLAGNQCPGQDPDSYDTGSGTGLNTEQCSKFGTSIVDLLSGGTSTSPTCPIGGNFSNCWVRLTNLSTLDETGTDLVVDHYRFECEAENYNVTPTNCRLEPGRFIRRRRQVADTLEMRADYFSSGTLARTHIPTPIYSETEIGSSWTRGGGTCARGDLEKTGGFPAITNTREGSYPSSGNQICEAAEGN